MRLILAFLNLAQLRLARHELARSEMLARWSEEAFARCEARVIVANLHADRAALLRR